MMDLLTDWIKNIILFILLATVMDMLLPSSSMQKYAKMVLGLLLITILVSPVLKLLSIDYDQLLTSAVSEDYVEKTDIENEIEAKKREIQVVQDAYILEEMALQLQEDGKEGLMNEFNYEIKELDVSLKTLENPEMDKDLQKIAVVLSPLGDAGQQDIETVAEVRIDTRAELPEAVDQTSDIIQFLAAQWDVEEEVIDISFERRGIAE
ncbi:MAG: stage III sporulation protein AF [Bacillus sp. (in: firmicutes)]